MKDTKPKRVMRQPTKDALRATIKFQEAQLRIRGEQIRELHRDFSLLKKQESEICAILRGDKDDELCPRPPYTWWRALFGFRHKPKDQP